MSPANATSCTPKTWEDCIALAGELHLPAHEIAAALQIKEDSMEMRSLTVAKKQKERWSIFEKGSNNVKEAALWSLLEHADNRDDLVSIFNHGQKLRLGDLSAKAEEKLDHLFIAKLKGVSTEKEICELWRSAKNCSAQKAIEDKLFELYCQKLKQCNTTQERFALYEQATANDPWPIAEKQWDSEGWPPYSNIAQKIRRHICIDILQHATNQEERWKVARIYDYEGPATEPALLSIIENADNPEEVRKVIETLEKSYWCRAHAPGARVVAIRKLVALQIN